MKIRLLPVLLSSILLSSLALEAKVVKKNEIKQTFDSDHGWWWYEEEIQDENNKTKKVKYKVSPGEKKKVEAEKKTHELLAELVKLQRENNKVTKEIRDRLDYAFPNTTPKYTTNKKTGEKCLTNSSKDCFVMPVIAEGQHVPALQAFLRNPSPENSKNWLQVQATYFNHINDVSNGLRFAFLKDGHEAYPTETTYSYGDNLFSPRSENVKTAREEKILYSMKEDIAYLIFVGGTRVLEESSSIFDDITSLESKYMKGMNKALIFKDKATLASMDKYVEDVIHKERKLFTKYNAWKKIKKTVRPALFKSYNVTLTPTTVIYYKNEKMDTAKYQTIEVGDVSLNSIRTQSINFLKYNGIINQDELSADKNWNVLEKATEYNKNTVKLPKGKVPNKNQNEGEKE